MAEEAFPKIAPPVYPLSEDYEDPAIRSGFDNGSEQTRPRFTTTRGTWVLKWTALGQQDYETLTDFYRKTVLGGSEIFTWTHPVTGQVHQVRFYQREPFQLVAPNIWSGSVTLKEA